MTQPPQGWEPPQEHPQHWPPPQPAGLSQPLQPQQQWGPPGWYPPSAPQPPSVLPVTPTEYPQFWRAPGIRWWRPVLAVVLTGIAFLAVALIATILTVVGEGIIGGMDPEELYEVLEGGQVTPGLVLSNSIAIAVMVPVTLLIAKIVRQPSRFLHSVLGRFRWKWFLTCVGMAVIVLGVNFAADLAMTGWEALELQIRSYTWWLLIGMMLVTPFQAAAEEYMLRGVLFRTVASWFRAPAVALGVGTLVNSGVFMLMHGASDMWLNLVYFTLGALLSWITWRTGGLEAAVAFHIVNNMLAFAIVPFQDVADLFDRSAGTAGPIVLTQLTASVILLLILSWMAGRRNLQRVASRP